MRDLEWRVSIARAREPQRIAVKGCVEACGYCAEIARNAGDIRGLMAQMQDVTHVSSTSI